MTTEATSPATKLCGRCGVRQPVDAFRRRSRSSESRHSWCGRCFDRYSAARRKVKRLKLAGEFLQQVNHYWQEPTHVESLARAAIQRHGGLERLVEDIDEWRRQAAAANKHHLTRRYYLAMVRLIAAADKARESRQPDLNTLSDGELKEYLRTAAREEIRQHPELLLEAAIESGWKITPPPGVLDDDEAEQDAADDQLGRSPAGVRPTGGRLRVTTIPVTDDLLGLRGESE